jgi:Rha family phage regulatory protein
MANHAHQLVTIHDHKAVTTSQTISQLFGKQHSHVRDAIRRIAESCPREFGVANFRDTSYVDSQGKVYPAYELTRDAFTLVAMSFTGERALQFKLAYVAAFNQMEAALQTQSQSKILATLDQAYDIESKLQDQVTSLKDELLDTYRTQVKLLGKSTGKRPSPRPVTSADVQQIHDLAAQGLSSYQIAAKSGRARSTVSAVLSRPRPSTSP